MRDYSSISPSAKSLLLMKGLTDIPFIADAARLIWGEATVLALNDQLKNELFLKRLLHFEGRYKSIDNLLETLGGNNILEISSGFSFRGLHLAINCPEVFYIDTDLPEIIELKADLTTQLINQQDLSLAGELLNIPMNALDKESFIETIAKFPAGPVNIVNEGLLVYLNTEEKDRLFEIIRQTLLKRGGYWITADIYIRKDLALITGDDRFSKFLEAHQVEENKFDSFEDAEKFFYKRGFKIHQKAAPIIHYLSALKYLDQQQLNDLIQQVGKIGRIRDTWALVPFR